MTTEIITENEITARAISSMPTRPTAPVAFGGKGYSAGQMKSAFDALPRLIIERLNALIEDIRSGRVCEDIPTGVEALPDLSSLLGGIATGELAAAIGIFDTTLSLFLMKLRSDVDTLLEEVGLL